MNTFARCATKLGLTIAVVSSDARAQTAPPSTPSGATAAPTSQNAQTATTEEATHVSPFSIAPLVGYGTGGLNFGFGVRGGYTLPMKVYIGGTFLYHLGSSTTSRSFGTSRTAYFYPGVELGYEFVAGRLVVRPYGGLGALAKRDSGTELNSAGAVKFRFARIETNAAFWPGVTVMYRLGALESWFVGGDVRLLLASGTSFTALFTGGIHF